APTCTGLTLDEGLDWWEQSERRQRCRARLASEGIDPDAVIATPEGARRRGLSSTVCFVTGNLVPDGAVIKSTAIDAGLLDADGVFRHVGPARVFTSEAAAIAALKRQDDGRFRPGEVLVLAGVGPMGTGMEEVYQVTSTLKHIPEYRGTPLITDARFSGVSTGPCIGHAGPEALAGGPLGRLRDGDMVRIVVETRALSASADVVTRDAAGQWVPDASLLAGRPPHAELAP